MDQVEFFIELYSIGRIDNEAEMSEKENFYHVYEEQDYIRITTKKFFPELVNLILITIIISCIGYMMVFLDFQQNANDVPEMVIVIIGSFLICISTALCYYTAVVILNRVQIVIDEKRLYITSKPIRWIGNKFINLSEIKSLYTEEKENSSNDYYHGKGDVSYIVGVLIENKRISITRFKKKVQAELMKQKIEECVYKQKKKVRI
ncbi:hypothetical protein VU04_02165 [Desulfobulbus sp. TB]|nr:hypothetical protein [Desulfobulbus sp. TB]